MRRSHAPSVRGSLPVRPPDTPPVRPVADNVENRMFQVMYGRISTKTTQKTFEKDGTLFLVDNTLTLRDEDGFLQCSMPYMRSIRLNDGCVLIIDDLKEVKIIREIGGKVKREIRRIKTEPVVDEHEEEEEEREFQPPRPIAFQRQVNASVNREIVIKQEVPDPDPEPETRQDEQPPTDTSIQTQAMQTQAIQTQAIPLDKEELIICCQASKRQILTFQRVYQEASTENQREELWEICNGIADPTSGKLEVLKGITTVSLERNETILIVADNEQVLNDLYDYGERNFSGSCEILITSRDVQETAKTGGFKAVFACTSLLPTLKDSGMTVHRSIVYENFSAEKTLPGINEITTGPVYHLIICGSIEERVLQVRYNLCPDGCNEEEFLNSQGDFLASETHKVLDCDCLKEDEVPVKRVRVDIINQEELKNWQHIPGGDDHKEEHFQVLNIPSELASSIVFIFKRRPSDSSSSR